MRGWNLKMYTISDVAEDLMFESARFSSVLKIPITNGGYLDTILIILQELKEQTYTLDSFTTWFMDTFSVIKSNSYNTRNMLERANLLRLTSEKEVRLTIDAEQCLNTSDPEIIICKNFLETFEGFIEVLLILESVKEINKKDLYTEWHSRFSKNFENSRSDSTDYQQFKTIMRYLISFKVINIETSRLVSMNKHQIEKILKLL